MVFSPKRLQAAIDEEVSTVNTEWRRVLNSTYTDRPLDPDAVPFVSLNAASAGVWCNGKRYGSSNVLFQQRTGGKAMEFTPAVMQEFWNEAARALGEYVLEHGYGQIVLTQDPLDADVKVANVRLNVYGKDIK